MVASDSLSTGFNSLDEIMGGGILPGSITQILSRPGVGRSTLCAHLAAATQKQRDGYIGWIDCDNSFDRKLMSQIMDLDRVVFVRPSTVEDAFSWADALLKVVNLLVIDSITALPTSSTLEEDDRPYEKLARSTIKLGEAVAANPCPLLMTVHAVNDRHILGRIRVAGGSIIGSVSHTRLLLEKNGLIHERDGSVSGHKLEVTAIKNAFAVPGKSAVLNVRRGIITDGGRIS